MTCVITRMEILLLAATKELMAEGKIRGPVEIRRPFVWFPKDREHGDVCTNIALQIARQQ